MAKGNNVKLRTLTDNLKVVTIINTPTGSANLYLALYQTEPKGDNSGIEVAYSGYARQLITFGTPAMNGSLAEILNTNDIEFPIVPAAAGNAGYAAILTAQAGGTLIYYGPLGATYTLNQGVQPTVPAGNLSVFEN